MKKFSIILLLIPILLISGCQHSSGKIDNFNDYKKDLAAIVEKATQYYEDNKTGEDHITLYLATYLDWSDSSIEDSVKKAYTLDLEYIWVADDYVIFWNDETKKYGILYSKTPSSAFKQLKSWYYNPLDSYKLDKYWYEIGQYTAI